MPEITISMATGRTDDQKAGMMRDITQALVTNLGVDADAGRGVLSGPVQPLDELTFRLPSAPLVFGALVEPPL